jgi:hypothetical protein
MLGRRHRAVSASLDLSHYTLHPSRRRATRGSSESDS